MSAMDPYTLNTVLTLQTLCACVLAPFGQYVYEHFLDKYPYPPNSTVSYLSTNIIPSLDFLKNFNDNNNKCSQDADTPEDEEALIYAQEASADLFFWLNLYSSLPVIIMTYILGLYVTKLGKRIVLLLPLFGTLIETTIQLLVIYFHLPEYCWYIGATLNGCTGAGGVQGFVMTLILIDSTDEDDLSARLVRLGAVQTAISAIVTFGVGYYIKWRGFTDLFWSGLVLTILTILTVLFFYKPNESIETNERTPLLTATNEQTPLLTATTEVAVVEPPTNICSNIFEVFTVFSPYRRSRKKNASIYLTLIAIVFFAFASSAYAPFLWFMLDVPFCWSSTDIGNYSALSAITSAILSVLGLKALQATGAGDAIICMISHLFFCASSLWVAFARRSWELYASLIVSAFSGYQSTLSTAMLTKWLEPSERPTAFAFITIMGTILGSISTAIFNWIYARTVLHYRNLTILIGAGLCIVPFILNFVLFLISRKMSEDELPPPLEEEVQPAPIHAPTVGVPHAGDPACILIPPRSLPTNIRTPPVNASPTHSVDNYQTNLTSDNMTNINI